MTPGQAIWESLNPRSPAWHTISTDVQAEYEAAGQAVVKLVTIDDYASATEMRSLQASYDELSEQHAAAEAENRRMRKFSADVYLMAQAALHDV